MFTTSQFALKAMNAICGEGTRPNPMALKKTMEKHMLMLMEKEATIERLTSNRKIKKKKPHKTYESPYSLRKAKALAKSKGLVPWIGRK